MAPAIEQQLELLRRTVEENERALASVRAALEAARRDDSQLGIAEAQAIAGLRRARLEIRAQTQHYHSLLARLPSTS